MAFMDAVLTQKGALYSRECSRCGAVAFSHEWAHYWDHNERRDAIEGGTLHCDQCGHPIGTDAPFEDLGRKWYAGQYSAPGYLDCTDWEYDTNLRRLERTLRDLYK